MKNALVRGNNVDICNKIKSNKNVANIINCVFIEDKADNSGFWRRSSPFVGIIVIDKIIQLKCLN